MVLVALSTIQLYAQHMKFMGVEMGGDAREFISALKGKGFKKIETPSINNVTFMDGRFAGYDDCTAMVYTSERSNKVYLVSVLFPLESNWAGLSTKYKNIKNMLVTKYGEPDYCIEEFNDYEPSDDYLKMLKARNGGCKYTSRFDLKEGFISLHISSVDDQVCISLGYTDDASFNEEQGNAIDDL